MDYNRMKYEVWYTHPDGWRGSPCLTWRKVAEFHFRFEAEKYISIFHGDEPERFSIVEKKGETT